MAFELQKLLWIAVAGGIGSAARYAMSLAAHRLTGWSTFPIGTLSVNVIGSLLLGFLVAALAGPVVSREIDERLRTALTIGFLGGFTTFSTFATESVMLAEARSGYALAANLVLNNGLALLAAFSGMFLARKVYGFA